MASGQYHLSMRLKIKDQSKTPEGVSHCFQPLKSGCFA
jgi:hypothetical protein